MADKRSFLQILSKLMEESYQPTVLAEVIGSISSVINDKLLPEISRTGYPSSPAILKRLGKLVSQLRTVSTFSEMAGKRTVYVYIDKSADIHEFLALEPNARLPGEALEADIPLVLFKGAGRDIACVNFADRMIGLSRNEFDEIVEGCKDSGIDLGGIVKAVIAEAPFKNQDLCVIYDTGDAAAFDMFEELITDVFVNTSDESYNGRFKGSPLYRGVLSQKAGAFRDACIRRAGYIKSYEDSFLSVYAEIEVYYSRRIGVLENSKKIITSDIVKEGSSDGQLSQLRLEEDNAIKSLTAERKKLAEIFGELRELFAEADKTLADHCGGAALRYDLDRVAERLFSYAESGMMHKLQDEIPTQLGKCTRDERDRAANWLLDYVCFAKTGALPNNAEINTHKPKYITDWKIAKAYAALVPYNRNDPLARQCVRAIENAGKPLTTGRELYLKAKSMTTTGTMAQMLMQSYKAGMTDAGRDLWVLYNKNILNMNLKEMADLHIPEFCVRLSEQRLSGFSGNNSISLSNPNLLYLKYAASNGYFPAIGLIVDTLYKADFEVSFTKERCGASVPYITSDTKKELAVKLIMLCRYLITNGYQTTHFRSLAGFMLFLIRDMNESMRMLSGVNSKLSNYCKAYMYEKGSGTVKNLESAVMYYEKAGDAVNAPDRLMALKAQIELEEEDEDVYDRNKTYTSTTTSSSSSSGCFITTAACTSLGKPDNCEELEAMRRFRDEKLITDKEGDILTVEYYRIAPEIVRKIDALPDAHELYRSLWDNYISSCYEYIKSGKFDEARMTYIRMVVGLCRKFEVSLREDVAKKYGSLA